MALSDYARPTAFYNGSPITQLTSLGMTTNSGQQRVDLLGEGLAGFTPGPGDVTISVGFAVPVGGLEFDYQQDCAAGEYVTMQFSLGRQYYIGQGKIQSVEASGSTGANTEGSFEWMGELKPFEG
jgi:hypothetical protein